LTGMWLKLVGLVLPLGLDTFAVAAALGIAGSNPRDRTRITATFITFEMGMPIVGFLAGTLVGRTLGTVADYLAVAILMALGIYMLVAHDEGEEARLRLLSRIHGLAVLGLGISVSIDELAIGFTIGLLRLPIVLVITLIGIQTLLVTQLGLRLGRRLGEQIREGAERAAGVALAVLGLVLLIERLT